MATTLKYIYPKVETLLLTINKMAIKSTDTICTDLERDFPHSVRLWSHFSKHRVSCIHHHTVKHTCAAA